MKNLPKTPLSPEETPTLRLEVKGLENCPSFKNTKSIFGVRMIKPGLWKGTPFIATNPRIKKWMTAAQKGLESQLLSAFQTTAVATWTAADLHAWMRLSMPEDDCWQCIPQLTIKVERVPKGQEGALIEITPLK